MNILAVFQSYTLFSFKNKLNVFFCFHLGFSTPWCPCINYWHHVNLTQSSLPVNALDSFCANQTLNSIIKSRYVIQLFTYTAVLLTHSPCLSVLFDLNRCFSTSYVSSSAVESPSPWLQPLALSSPPPSRLLIGWAVAEVWLIKL